MSEKPQSWQISISRAERISVALLLLHPSAPRVKGVAAISRRTRLRRALVLDDLITSLRAVGIKRGGKDEQIRFAIPVTVENAETFLSVVDAMELTEDDMIVLGSIIEQMEAGKLGSPLILDGDIDDLDPSAEKWDAAESQSCPACGQRKPDVPEGHCATCYQETPPAKP